MVSKVPSSPNHYMIPGKDVTTDAQITNHIPGDTADVKAGACVSETASCWKDGVAPRAAVPRLVSPAPRMLPRAAGKSHCAARDRRCPRIPPASPFALSRAAATAAAVSCRTLPRYRWVTFLVRTTRRNTVCFHPCRRDRLYQAFHNRLCRGFEGLGSCFTSSQGQGNPCGCGEDSQLHPNCEFKGKLAVLGGLIGDNALVQRVTCRSETAGRRGEDVPGHALHMTWCCSRGFSAGTAGVPRYLRCHHSG